MGDKADNLALLDSGANIHIATMALVKLLNVNITYFRNKLNINTAANGEHIEAIGKILVDGYIGAMLVIPQASQNLLSTTLLTMKNLQICFTTDEKNAY